MRALLLFFVVVLVGSVAFAADYNVSSTYVVDGDYGIGSATPVSREYGVGGVLDAWIAQAFSSSYGVAEESEVSSASSSPFSGSAGLACGVTVTRADNSTEEYDVCGASPPLPYTVATVTEVVTETVTLPGGGGVQTVVYTRTRTVLVPYKPPESPPPLTVSPAAAVLAAVGGVLLLVLLRRGGKRRRF